MSQRFILIANNTVKTESPYVWTREGWVKIRPSDSDAPYSEAKVQTMTCSEACAQRDEATKHSVNRDYLYNIIEVA